MPSPLDFWSKGLTILHLQIWQCRTRPGGGCRSLPQGDGWRCHYACSPSASPVECLQEGGGESGRVRPGCWVSLEQQQQWTWNSLWRGFQLGLATRKSFLFPPLEPHRLSPNSFDPGPVAGLRLSLSSCPWVKQEGVSEVIQTVSSRVGAATTLSFFPRGQSGDKEWVP